jgi:hypothetical protein
MLRFALGFVLSTSIENVQLTKAVENQHTCLIVLLKENIVSGRRGLSAFGENPVLVTLWQKETTHWKVMPREISVFDKRGLQRLRFVYYCIPNILAIHLIAKAFDRLLHNLFNRITVYIVMIAILH